MSLTKPGAFAVGAVLFICAALAFRELSFIRQPQTASIRLHDRNGALLRELSSSEDGAFYPVRLSNLPEHLIDTVVGAEDKRFFRHNGIDILAIARSAAKNLKNKKVVSGGSTITQQLVRNIYHYPRKMQFKIIEAVRAICIEARYSKRRILEEYLNRIPYSNRTFGIEAASKLYFGKSAVSLSMAEGAFLTAIPGANTLYDPYRNYIGTLKRQKRLLTRLYLSGKIGREEYEKALDEKIILSAKNRQFIAPHYCEWIMAKYGEALPRDTYTTLDAVIQQKVEYIIENHLERLKNARVSNASAIVIENHSGDVLAYAGSADYFNDGIAGQVNGVNALRQPGSAVKPFVYGMALESGMTAADILPDLESSISVEGAGFFVPKNYDKKYHGPVRVRTALACSYNIATVNLASQFDNEAILHKLHQAGFESLKESAKFYGPGLCLGSGEVTLFELGRAYSGLARGGRLKGLKVLLDEPDMDMGRFLSQEAAYIVTDILSDNSAREPAFGEFSPIRLPFVCAAKTGTSKDFRDNWTVGYTPRYTVAVWTGNFDGKPMVGVSGISGAGLIFRDIMLTLEVRNTDLTFKMPKNILKRKICAKSGALPNGHCAETMEELFIKGTERNGICIVHRKMCGSDKRDRGSSGEYKEAPSAKIYEVYPPEYHDWAVESGIEMPPADLPPYDQAGTAGTAGAHYEIEFPNDGDVFKIDPILRREYQTIKLKPGVNEDVTAVNWKIGDRVIPADNYPFSADYKLEEGIHIIGFTALKTGGEKVLSRNIKISVVQ